MFIFEAYYQIIRITILTKFISQTSISIYQNILIYSQLSLLQKNSKMINEVQPPTLIIKEIKTYSRKQLTAWVNQSQFAFSDLNNGLFFLNLLQKLIPNETHRQKIYGRANNQYEYTYNLKVLKKILNKHNMQKDMDPNSISQTKNCFELANWFKNLYEQNKDTVVNVQGVGDFIQIQKSYTPSKFDTSLNYKSPSSKQTISRAISSDLKNKNIQWKPNIDPKQQGVFSRNFFNSTLKLAPNLLPSQQFSKTTFFPRNKSESVLKKKPVKTYMKKQSKQRKESIAIPTSKPPQRKKEERVAPLDFSKIDSRNREQASCLSIDQNMDLGSNEEYSEIMIMMRKESLNDSIRSFEGILTKIRQYISNPQNKETDIDNFRKTLSGIIYMKQ